MVTDLPHTRNGGIAKVAGEVARGLAKLGQTVVCYCLRREENAPTSPLPGVEVRYIEAPFSLNPDYPVITFSHRALREVCADGRDKPYDVVQTFNLNAAALPVFRERLHAQGSLLAHANFETLAMDVAAKWIEFRNLPSLSCLLQILGEAALMPLYEKRYIRAADLLITEDVHTRDALNAMGAHPGHIRLIPSGVDIESAGRARQIPPPWEEKHPGPIIGYLGRVDPRKGVQYLLAAMPKVLRKYPQALLFLAGGSRQRYDRVIREQIRRLRLESNVHMLGRVEGDMFAWYRLADVVAIPSLSEGIPITLMEALACGANVVITRLPGVVPFLRGHDFVHWAEPADADDLAESLLAALEDPDKRKRAELGQQFVRAYSWDRVAARYLEAYKAAKAE